jgi:hypothetical protein
MSTTEAPDTATDAREHIEREHQDIMQRSDEQVRERVAGDAYDVVEAMR